MASCFRLALLSCCVLVATASAEHPNWEKYSETQPHMGSTVTIVVYAKDEEAAKQAIQKGFDRIKELNAIFSDYDTNSECMKLSRAAPTNRPLSISDEMAELLGISLNLSAKSDGAFDITVGPLTKLWRRARHKKAFPDAQRLQKANEATGFELLKLNSNDKQLELTRPGMRLDFGGIAKGYAADQALAAVQQAGCQAALVNAGGDIALGNAPPDKNGWRVGVAPLQPRSPPSRILSLKKCGVATSGDAWQYLEIDGKRYSHIIDPRTGTAVSRRCAVTIVAHNCTLADGLASAVTVVNAENGFALVKKFKDASCLVVEDRNGKTVTMQSAVFPPSK